MNDIPATNYLDIVSSVLCVILTIKLICSVKELIKKLSDNNEESVQKNLQVR